MPRAVVLVTTNLHKLGEYARRLSQYGLTLHHEHTDPDALTPQRIGELLEQDGVIAVMRERSNLYVGEEIHTERAHLQVVTNRTALTVDLITRTGGREQRRYVREIPGYIDQHRRQRRPGVFGWDDIFVSAQTGRTYLEMRGLKLSARDLVLSDFARDRLWYRAPIQLRWRPGEGTRSIDFRRDPVRFLAEHPHYRLIPPHHPLRAILSATLRGGLFFRAAKNRREKNYWIPGLNAGVPFVPKADDVHEATFMFHDLMHFAFPDLLFDGRSDHAARVTYIAHRMMSEAFTLVLADMGFADLLAQQGVDYDFTPRRILPLLTDTGLRPEAPGDLRKLLTANARYCLLGDESGWLALGVRPETLARFCDKYAQFFVSDFRWTAQNFASMVSRFGPRAAQWLSAIAPIRQRLPQPTPTISDAVEQMTTLGVDFERPESIVEGALAMYLDRLDALTAAPSTPLTAASCLQQGFCRYLMGQLAVTVAYDFLPRSAVTARLLCEATAELETWQLADVERLRGFFDQYIDLLWQRKLISEDDRDTWKEVFPLFEPHYVDYDVDLTAPLSAVAASVLSR